MKHLKLGIPAAGALALIIGLGGCADENPWGSSSNEKGSISLSLTTDSGIKTAKPVFRSGEDENAQDPNDLSTYIRVPKPEEFSIKLEKSDESFSKTWTSLQGFLNYTKENFFDTGAYTMTAYYGEKGKQDFNAPYFEASTSFNVLSDQVQEINLVAELMNSMVKVNYTEGFQNYMKDYHSRIRTEGRADEIIYSKDQAGLAFIEPNNAALTVHFTTKTNEYQSSVSLGEFPPMAKTLHNITMDIADKGNGDATLTVTFDDTLEDEEIHIDLTKELFTTPAPEITCIGFENGETLDMLEGSSSLSEIKMNVNAPGKLKSASLTVESSTNYRPAWGSEIDLCSAKEEQKQQIIDAGITATGFGLDRPIASNATLDLTNFGKNLPTGTHKISLQVTDSLDKISKVASVTFDSQPIAIDVVEAKPIAYGANTAMITIDYNGVNPDTDVVFAAKNPTGGEVNFIVDSYEEVMATRGFENKRYIYTLTIPHEVSTAKESIPVKVYHNGTTLKAECQIQVTIPKYNLEFDAFSEHAFVRVITPEINDANVISTIIKNISIRLNGEIQELVRDSDHNIIAIGNLKPATNYSVTSTITSGGTWDENKGSFTTETELEIPNGDFTELGTKVEIKDLQVGGKYNVWPVDYTLKSSIDRDEPAGWATVNSLTAWSGSSNKNTWFIAPSSWVEKGQGLMKSVGYHHNGTTPSKSGGPGNTKYYCENAPSNSQLNKAAGELFLGTYSFNGNEHRDEGIGFASRPSAISFDYEYTSIDNVDEGYAHIKVVDANNNPLSEETYYIKDTQGTKTINLQYDLFGNKASKLIVSFKSSKNSNPPIDIPSGSALNEHQSLGNHTLDANTYHALATGSVLKIDNVKAIYGNTETPANAPKKSSKKRK